MKKQADANFNLIIPKGTQIVLLNETKVINENRFHQKGTVGKIVGTPTDASHAYQIEFPDGTRGMANRKSFSIRKHFQTEQSGLISPLEDYELFDYVIYRCVVGSKAFGLDDANSDTDRRGIYLPPATVHWSMFGVPEQIESKDTEECYWALRKFLMLALKANPNILECLFTPLVEYRSELASELLSIRRIFLSKLVYQTYNGYVMSQFKKLEQDLRSAGAVKWKHAMHLIRLLLQGIEILREAHLIVPVSAHRAKLLAIKNAELDWREVGEWRVRLHREFDEAFARTNLPENPDYGRANEFLIRARRSAVFEND